MEDARFRRGANKDVSHPAECAGISIPKEFRVDCRQTGNDSCLEIGVFSFPILPSGRNAALLRRIGALGHVDLVGE